jgi:hypothetical protein
MAKDLSKLSAVWKTGRTEWKLDSNQEGVHLLMMENWEKQRIHVLNMSRQIGKSYYLVWLADSYARRYPRARIKYAAETGKQVRAIVRPHMAELLSDCPIHLRPEFNTMDGEFRYPNGSTITVAGCETDSDANKLLGQHADLCIVDEAGSIKGLNYVVRTVLLPQTLNTNGRIIICSTPAKTADHPFKSYCDQAETNDVLIQRTIYDNPRATDEVIAEYMAASGGEDSTDWQREYLVRHVTDADLAILKFATQKRLNAITLTIDPKNPLAYRPQWFNPYTSYDMGWSPDGTGILWGYWDYARTTLVIENEWLMRRMDTNTLALVTSSNEEELYGSPTNVFQRWADMDERLGTDLQLRHNLTVNRSSNDNPHAACNAVNLMIAGIERKLAIHPRCKLLKEQMRDGVWDKSKKKFARSVKHLHYDLLASLATMCRNVAYDKLPDRMIVPRAPRNFLVVPEDEEAEGGVLSSLKAAFGLG